MVCLILDPSHIKVELQMIYILGDKVDGFETGLIGSGKRRHNVEQIVCFPINFEYLWYVSAYF